MCGLAGFGDGTGHARVAASRLESCREVIAGHEHLANMRTAAEEAAFALLALEAPVAADLRIVVESMQHVADAERMGGLARHVAEIVRRRHPGHTLPAEVNDCFAEMAKVAVNLGSSAKDVVLPRDFEGAAQCSRDDEVIDELRQHRFTLLKERDWTHGVESAVDVALLGRFYERFAYHAVEIGRRVIFQETGEIADP